MRLSVILLCCSVAGVLGGAAIIGLAVLGGALMFVALCAGAWAVLRDDGQAQPSAREAPGTLAAVLERARDAA